MAKTGEISVNLPTWDSVTNKVSTQVSAINANIAIDAHVNENHFSNLSNLIARIDEMEALIASFAVVVEQEVSNMRLAATLMQERDQSAATNLAQGYILQK